MNVGCRRPVSSLSQTQQPLRKVLRSLLVTSLVVLVINCCFPIVVEGANNNNNFGTPRVSAAFLTTTTHKINTPNRARRVPTMSISSPPTTSKSLQQPQKKQKLTGELGSTSNSGDGKFHFSIDRGGTFTDVHCILPNGTEKVTKLLSEDPDNYPDAPTEGIRRLLQQFDVGTPTTASDGPSTTMADEEEEEEDANRSQSYPRGTKVYTGHIGSIRMGTTVATNALLERRGERMGLLITKGFRDLLKIGNQSRSNIFDLTCAAPGLLYEDVKEVEERVMLATFLDESQEEGDGNNSTPTDTEEDTKEADELEALRKDNDFPTAGIGPRITGITGETIIDLQPPNLDKVRAQLQDFANAGIKSIAIVLTHSYTYDHHERLIEQLAHDMNCFTEISTSSRVMPMVKMVSRGHTACAAAYLTPKISNYLASFREGFDEGLESDVRLAFMKSDGGLSPVDDFGGHQAILSGPAGGVVVCDLVFFVSFLCVSPLLSYYFDLVEDCY